MRSGEETARCVAVEGLIGVRPESDRREVIVFEASRSMIRYAAVDSAQ
jgi:hypothetical protein